MEPHQNFLNQDTNIPKFGNYNIRLLVTSEYGCTDSLVVMNAFSDLKYFIEFPNAFIPNPHGPSGGYYSSKSDESRRYSILCSMYQIIS